MDLLHRIQLDASPEDTRKAIMTPKGWSSWWASTDEDFTIHFDGGTVSAKFRKIKDSGAIVFECTGGDIQEWFGTRLRFEIEKNSHTILTFTHENWQKSTDYMATCNTQWGLLLKASLKPYLEEGKGHPM